MNKALIFSLCLSIMLSAHAQEGKQAPPKKKLDTNIFESESSATVFTAKVKTYKKSQGDYLVYFEDVKKSGPYVLSENVKDFTTYQHRIAKSAGKSGPNVSVSIDENDNITSVVIAESKD